LDHFIYRNGQLYAEDVAIDDLAAEVGTPAYVYSRATFEGHFDRLSTAFRGVNPLVCFSIKSCANLTLLRLLLKRGAGMDVVSGGELYRAMVAGCDPKKVVYAGVGKTDAEIEQSLQAGIGWFNIESEQEFENVAAIARRMRKRARAALRVNPDVADARTHYKTSTGQKESKFGVDYERAIRFFETYGRDEWVELPAIHLHLGSPTYSPEPYGRAIHKALQLIKELRERGFTIKTLDIGGGYAADYESGVTPSFEDYAQAIVPLLRDFVESGGGIIMEPGRSISANSAILVTRVLYVKEGGTKTFAIVDTGMHHLIRPTLYEAFQFMWPSRVPEHLVPKQRAKGMDLSDLLTYEIVGPICESSDYLAKARAIPRVQRGDLLCIFGSGAYGMVMASQYNSMPRPPEVLVDGSSFRVIRERETYEDLVRGETL